MTLAVGASCVTIAGIHGAYQIAAERGDLERAFERDIRVVGAALRVSVENALRDGQTADIHTTLERLEQTDPAVDVLVLDARDGSRTQSPGHLRDRVHDDMLAAAMTAEGPVLRFARDATPPQIVLGLPLRDVRQNRIGGLVVARPLEELYRDLAATERAIAASMLLLAVAIAVVQGVLAARFVTRPLDVLSQSMRRLRHGDLTAPDLPPSADEVGALRAEFETLVSELRDTREHLAQAVESRRTLERGLQRVDKLVTIGHLSASLAHEIGSPLQIVGGRARALVDRPHDPDEVRRHATILVAQTDRIGRVIAQLMTYARRRPVRLAETDLSAPARAILDLLESVARRRGVALELACSDPAPRALVDVDQIQQVVLNLLNNAIEATPPGGRIRLHIDRSSITPAGEPRPIPAARLVVEDTGGGIPVEHLPRVFDPFFTMRADGNGTGLGLAVVRAIVLDHGGAISATSNVGHGSRFVVELPLRGPVGRERKEAS
jgi:signal transduction histidine kinase